MSAQASATIFVEGSNRLPARENERLYDSYGGIFRSITAFGSAVWVFLMGSILPSVGDTRLGIVGYVCGVILGTSACLTGIGLPCFRYGIDSVDASKTFLGVRGAVAATCAVLLMALGWASVVMAMIARGMALLIAEVRGAGGQVDESLCIGLSLAVLILCWTLLRNGYRFVQRANDVVGPGLLIVATISLCLLAYRYGAHRLLESNVAARDALTDDRRKGLCYALEFGLATALTWWPFMGGICRLVRYRRHVVTPLMTGTLCGGSYCSVVAALAAVSVGTADPVIWLIRLAGPVNGTVIVALVLLMSIPALCMLIYFAAGSMQQVRSVARIRWDRLVAWMLAPLALAAFDTHWVLSHVATIATYSGLMFLQISIIGAVDFHLLRSRRIALEQVFAATSGGRYWFWGGVNWVAIAVVAAGIAAYLALYDPISLSAAAPFRYVGASLPVMSCAGIVYYGLMRLIALPAGLGGYTYMSGSRACSVEVRL